MPHTAKYCPQEMLMVSFNYDIIAYRKLSEV